MGNITWKNNEFCDTNLKDRERVQDIIKDRAATLRECLHDLCDGRQRLIAEVEAEFIKKSTQSRGGNN